MLGNRVPMLLFWGVDLHCFYNDAFRPSLGEHGEHPQILGMPAEQVWSENWSSMGPLVSQVLAGEDSDGGCVFRNGVIEDVYWTFSYSAVRGDSNQIEGVLVNCTETTDKLKAFARTSASETRLSSIVQQVPVAMALMKGPVKIVNQRALELWGRERSKVENRSILEVLPELKEQGFGALQ